MAFCEGVSVVGGLGTPSFVVRAMSRLLFLLLLSGPIALPVAGRAGGPYSPSSDSLMIVVLQGIGSTGEVQDDPAGQGENTRLVSGALAVLLGPFGAHRLYLGTTPRVAVVYGITFGGFGVLALLDLGHILFTKDLGDYRDNGRVFMWNRSKGGVDVTPP